MAIEKTIELSEVLQRMDNGEVFALKYVKADRTRGTAGQIVDLPAVSKLMKVEGNKKSNTPPEPAIATAAKNPNHYQNATRNLRIIGQREPKKVHIRLMLRFNGMRIL